MQSQHGWYIGSLLLGMALLGPIQGVAEATPHAGKLKHELQKLQVLGRVLYVAAHPDDENTRLLTYLANERKLETGYLSITRGDGGQNLIGSEITSLLGVLRTQELLQARKLDGARQFFTRAKDFGYSKSPIESLRFWGHKTILADVVWVLRTFRPDVVITRFPEKGRTHGHHLASARLAREAFEAAGDPKRFPEQLKHTTVWKPKRLIHNVSTWMLRRRGLLGRKDILAKFQRLDVGTYNPLLGRSYGEIAATSRSMHKSQGFGVSSYLGPIYEYFQHIGGFRAKGDILEGLDLGWSRIPKGVTVTKQLQAALRDFRATTPQKALPHLLEALAAINSLLTSPSTHTHLLKAKKRDLLGVIKGCLGLYLDARTKSAEITPGGSTKVKLLALERIPLTKAKLTLHSVRFVGAGVKGKRRFTIAQSLKHHRPWRRTLTLQMAANAPVSALSWLRQTGTFGTYTIPKATKVARPFDPAPLQVEFVLQLGKEKLTYSQAIRRVWSDRVRGQQSQTLSVMPPMTTTPELPVAMFPNHKTRTIAFQVRSSQPNAKGSLTIELPKGWRCKPVFQRLSFRKAGSVKRVRFDITPPKGAKQSAIATPVVVVGKRKYRWKVHMFNYAHVPNMAILEPAVIKLVPVRLKALSSQVGYIPGSGDLVAASLGHVGVKVSTIDAKTLATGDLNPYKIIVTGIRAWNANRTLRQHHARLMEWVKKGGTLLVQYNTNSWWRPLGVPVGPFPMTIGRGRVTDETAPIKMLQPKHPLLRQPHHITAADFKGWVQERGLYFAKKWDKRYTPILEMADPGKRPLRGSLLVAHAGKGAFLYAGISFFRQLPAGVPGAYRLLLNLLAYRHTSATSAPTKGNATK